MRLVRNCHHLPLIRELKPDGSFGDIVVINPDKVEETLAQRSHTRGWLQIEIGREGIDDLSRNTDCTTYTDHITDAWNATEQQATSEEKMR
jgi:hypothetical protein